MILDIRFRNREPIQLQNVRHVTHYGWTSGKFGPELVIHFSDNQPQINLPLDTVLEINYTND